MRRFASLLPLPALAAGCFVTCTTPSIYEYPQPQYPNDEVALEAGVIPFFWYGVDGTVYFEGDVVVAALEGEEVAREESFVYDEQYIELELPAGEYRWWLDGRVGDMDHCSFEHLSEEVTFTVGP